ncbi:MAG: NADH-quinone oxidoreductase subunit L [Bacteroidetes bacterium]|jgi:NADH-quinone oxidoreductase subunit L|nr:NADH-quinone oxidoreductase subunit L [Bacteroidota bacterium]
MDVSLLVRLILLLPLVGALVNGLAPLFLPSLRQSEGLIGTLGTAVVAIPFALTLYLFMTYGGDPVVVDFYTWMAAGDLSLDFAYRVDELSLIMTLIVTGVGGVIHLYSVGYMHGDDGFWRFFAYLNLFIFAMLNLVLANNLPVLFLGWEGVGLCSYLLIGFWYTDLSNSAAANKAFIVNRIGDFAFLMAMFLLFSELGSLDFDVLLNEGVSALSASTINWAVLLLFIGATGKSAQIPLFVWLPDAMAGPTPVSALIHAATMVTSGLYLLARLSPLVLNAPVIMAVIAIVGALTAIMAATIAIAQYDIKKVLAYSTVSQLGYMFMAAGVGAFFVAIFHVLTHAFFKACLFLGSGSVIHSMEHVEHELEHEHGEDMSDFDPQDMRTMGNLGRFMPSTSATYLIATFAISGIPLLAGFFSKDEILFKAFEYGFNGHPYAWFVWGVGIITALLTAFYMTRSYVLTFRGSPRWPKPDVVHPHESPTTMTAPLWILAFFSVVAGFIGLPAVIADGKWNLIHHYLGAPYGGPVAEPELAAHVPLALEWGLIALGSLIAIGGVAWAWRSYSAHGVAYDDRLQARLGSLYDWWQGKYYWDEAYDRTVVRPLLEGSRQGLWPFDDYVVDGAVNGVARLAQGASGVLRRLQTGVVQNYALAIVLGVVLVIGLMLFG